LLVIRQPDYSLVAVQVWFAGGDKHRDYVIWHRPGRSGFMRKPRSAAWSVRTLALPAKKGEFDLRKPADAAKLEKVLASFDPAELAAAG
jgi:hypothetical protein